MNIYQFRWFKLFTSIMIVSSCFLDWSDSEIEFYTILMFIFIPIYYIKQFIRVHGSRYIIINVFLVFVLLISLFIEMFIILFFLICINAFVLIYHVIVYFVFKLMLNDTIQIIPWLLPDFIILVNQNEYTFTQFLLYLGILYVVMLLPMPFCGFIFDSNMHALICIVFSSSCFVLCYLFTMILRNTCDRSRRWQSLHNIFTGSMLTAFACSISLIIAADKNKYASNYGRNVYEVMDLLPLCINIPGFILIVCTELKGPIEFEIKRIIKILPLYYKSIKTFLVYLVIVSISAGIFVFLFTHASEFVTSFVEREEKTLLQIHSILERNRDGYLQNGMYVYERYVNEDVQLVSHNKMEIEFRENTWYRNNKLLISNDRIHINDGEVNITLIRLSDFGIYKCLTKHKMYDWYPIWYNERLYRRLLWHTYNNQVALFLLKQPEHRLSNTYYVEQGRILYLTAEMLLSQANHDELSVEYKVNDIDVHDLCVSDFMSCRPFAYYVKKSYKDYFQNKVDIEHWMGNTRVTLKTCVCSGMYGLHKLSIYREFFNRTTGANVVVELDYPIRIYMFPMDNDTFIYDELYESSLSIQAIQRLFNKTDEIVIPSMFWFPEYTLNVSFIVNAFVFSILTGVMSIFFWFFKRLIRFYCNITIAPFRNRLLFRTFTVPSLPSTTRPLAGLEDHHSVCYDVYISSCEEDYNKAMTIVTFLENDCQLKVCFPVRDLANEGNRSYFESFSRATLQCRMFVVLLSECYTKDEMCNDVQLISCILPLIHSSRRQGRDLVFLKLDNHIDIPIQISYDPDVTIIRYMSDDDEVEVKRKLRRSLFTNIC
ncbi:hypothetical protein ACF0H5_020146 [Mactra antiquata]